MKKITRIVLTLIIVLWACKKGDEPIPAKDEAIVGWGDSLTFGTGGYGTTYLTALSDLTGIKKTYNKGRGGEKSTQVKDRMIVDTALHKYPTIIWVGTNNVGNNETIKEDIAEMISKLGHTHYIVLSVMNGGLNLHEEKGTQNWQSIIDVNKDLAVIYGEHFIDIRSYLVSLYNPDDPQDATDHENDVPPASLRVGKIHLTAKGYTIVAEQIYKKIDLLIDK